MPYSFFRVSTVHPATGEELNEFLKSRRIVSIEKQFHANGSEGYWSFCVEWIDGSSITPNRQRRSKIDYKDVLSEHEFSVFSKLRIARKELSERDGVPVYAVATNEQLAEISKMNQPSLATISAINGFGPSKVEKYGNELLKQIATSEVDTDGETNEN